MSKQQHRVYMVIQNQNDSFSFYEDRSKQFTESEIEMMQNVQPKARWIFILKPTAEQITNPSYVEYKETI